MTKREFIDKFAEKTGFTKKDSAKAVDAFFETLSDSLKAGDRIMFPGVFKAEVVTRAARVGKNPHTGEAVPIPAKKGIKAKISDNLLK